jgi:CRP-like cAMP-binding protein
MNQEIVINRLIEMLDDRNKDVVAETIKSLVLFGEKAIPFLIKAVSSGKRAVKNGAITTLEKLEVKDVDFYNIIAQEINSAYRNLLDIHTLEQEEQNEYTALLIRHLTETNQEIAETVFKILKIFDTEGKLKFIEKGLKTKDKNQLAIAIETLESSINPQLIRNLIPLLDEIPKQERLAIARKQLKLKSDNLFSMLKRLLEKESRTTQLCALYLIGNAVKDKRYVDTIKDLCNSEDNIIKETASLALQNVEERKPKGGPSMLSTMDKILFLKKVPVFSDLKVRELTAISSITEEKDIKKDLIVFKEGDQGDSMYIVISGGVSIIKNFDRPNATVLAHIKEGDYFGEMALFESAPRSATVKTDDNTKLLNLGKFEFEEIMHEFPSISINICKVLSSRLRVSSDKVVNCYGDAHRIGESRQHPRFKTDLKARVSDPSSSMDTVLDNISLGGAFVKSETVLAPETTVTITVDAGEGKESLTVEGKVIRSISTSMKGMSIQFSQVKPEIESFIEKFFSQESQGENEEIS